MSRTIHTEIYITASPRRVWSVLEDTARYPEWNTFVRRIAGILQAGERLDVELAPPGGQIVTMRPVVLEARTDYRLRWLGSLGIPGLLDGEHTFEIADTRDNQVRFMQREAISGDLAPIGLRMIGKQTEQGFLAMNDALKRRVEAAETSGVNGHV